MGHDLGRRVLILLQVLGLVASAAAFAASLLLQDEVRGAFRVTINDHLARSLKRNVDLAEQLLESRPAATLLASRPREVARTEIRLYRRDPLAYVTHLTGGAPLDQARVLEVSASDPAQRAMLEKVIGWRGQIRARFEASFAQISGHVAIVLGTNVAALGFALALSLWGRRLGREALLLSIALTAAVWVGLIVFMSRDWVYAFLRNDWAVMGYPTTLAILTPWILLRLQQWRHARDDLKDSAGATQSGGIA